MPKMVLLEDEATVRHEVESMERRRGIGPSAIVVGGAVNGLGVARALARAGIGVLLVTDRARAVASTSRSVELIVLCDDIYYGNLVRNLSALGRHFAVPPVLYLTHDFQVARVAESNSHLRKYYRFLLPEKSRVEAMLDKSAFRELARRSGLLVPETNLFEGVRDFQGFLKKSGYEKTWVVKPFRKSDAFESRFGKARFLRTENEWKAFEESYGEIDVPALVQEMIPGPDTNVLFGLVVFDAASTVLMSFCGRKIRQYKPVVGNTASAEPISKPAVLEETVRFFEANRFTGMGSLEFKLHQSDGKLYAIEPTIGRTNLQSEVAVINGFNLPAAYFWTCCGSGDQLETVRAKAAGSQGRRVWMRFEADLMSAWYYWRRRELSLLEWLYPFTRRVEFAVFRWTDPLPALVSLWRRCLSRAAKIVKAIGGEKIIGAVKSRSRRDV